LNNADLPTLGRPIMATFGMVIGPFIARAIQV
jgi:hypothetical protein